jgi:hypothetical protein
MNVGSDMIGGFLGLELPEKSYPLPRGHDCIYVNSGRAALELILRSMQLRGRIFVPYYTCDSVLSICKKMGVEVVYYRIGSDLRINDPSFDLKADDLLVYTNYFGIMEDYVDELSQRWGDRLIVDNCLALYARRRPGIPSFYSLRKFSGLADGGIVEEAPAVKLPNDRDVSSSTATFLFQQIELKAQEYVVASELNEDRIARSEPRRISRLTERMMGAVDYRKIADRRLANFYILHEALASLNKLTIDLSSVSVPFCYPFWTNLVEMRNELIDSGICLPIFWENVLNEAPYDGEERKLARYLLPLPIDHRLDRSAMEYIIKCIHCCYC